MRYRVERAGKPYAEFVFARDAFRFIAWSVEEGPFSREDYDVKDVASGRTVTGTTGHGRAILETLRRHEAQADASTPETKP